MTSSHSLESHAWRRCVPISKSGGINVDDPQLPEQIARTKQGEARAVDVPQELTGIAGFHQIQVAEIALTSLDEGRQEEQRLICGKIRDYVYDKNERSGHLAVDTRIEIFNTVASYNVRIADSVERYHWDIDINGIYQEILRDDTNPNDPFPNTVKLPEAAKDPSNPNGIWLRGGPPGLDHKLYAQGSEIEVRHVYQKFDNGSIVRLDDAHPTTCRPMRVASIS